MKRDTRRNPSPRRAYGIAEVAESLGVSSGFVRLEIQRGRLATLRIGRRVLIASASLDKYINAAAAHESA